MATRILEQAAGVPPTHARERPGVSDEVKLSGGPAHAGEAEWRHAR